jgi:hypothetical protein
MKRKIPILTLLIVLILTSCGTQSNETVVEETTVETTSGVETVEEQSTMETETETETETKESNQELVKREDYEVYEDTVLIIGTLKNLETDETSITLYCEAPNKYVGVYMYIRMALLKAYIGEDYDITPTVTFDSVWLTPVFCMDIETNEMYTSETMSTILAEGLKNGELDTDEIDRNFKKSINDYFGTIIFSPTANATIHEDDNVKITFTDIGDNGVNFSIENKTDNTITVQVNTIAINGVSTNSALMSAKVAPQSTGTGTARCSDFSDVSEVERISGTLTVILDESFKNSYKVTFSETLEE